VVFRKALRNWVAKKTWRFRRRARTIVTQRLNQAKITLKYFILRKNKRAFFMLSTPRTGSHMLVDYLNSIPGVSFSGEVLQPLMPEGLPLGPPAAALRHIAYSLNNCRQTVCGVKLHGEHLAAHGLRVDDLRRHFPLARYIVLYRRSLADQYLSLLIAMSTGRWTYKNKTELKSFRKIVINRTELLMAIQSVRQWVFEYF